jgi:hypothetical protein
LALYAIKDGVSLFDQNTMNSFLGLQDFKLIYEGTAIDSKTGAGVTENNVHEYSFAIRITATGVTSISRIELELAADGTGQDVTLTLKDTDFNPDGSNEGTTLATVTVPLEHVPAAAAYFSAAINAASGFSAGDNLWLIVSKVGDSTNHFHLISEASQDAAHPCYRRSGSSGAWTANNAIHFKAYSGNTGDLIHSINGTNGITTIAYNGEDISKVYRYLPPSDGAAGGIRDVIALTYDGDYLTTGVVT